MALYILLIIILFLALVLFVPINFIIEYKDHLKIVIKFVGIGFCVYSGSKKERSVNKNKIEKKPKKRFKKCNFKKDIIMSLKKSGIILKSTQYSIRQIAKKIEIRTLKLILYIGAEDAAETAIKYGQANALVYPIISIVDNLSKPKEIIVNIIPNFPSEKTNADFKIDMKSSIFKILALIIILFRNYKKTM